MMMRPTRARLCEFDDLARPLFLGVSANTSNSSAPKALCGAQSVNAAQTGAVVTRRTNCFRRCEFVCDAATSAMRGNT